ncbi:uncharacterized protein [Drosophila kikkawai]|uniref:Uncharacterized protein LOC108080231 n=1 Tax=Drosophila kikkawai TaxID=30033 RepID=A0A6P4J4R1_DROKI|nr:uncharacterized protein LOC108080231 [Drosophila kikkawai]
MQKKPNDSKPEEYDLLIEANMANIGIPEEDDFDEDGTFDEEILEEILEDEEDWFINQEAVFNEEESIGEMSQEDSYNYNDDDNVQPRGFVDPEDSVDPLILSDCGSETCLVCRPHQ